MNLAISMFVSTTLWLLALALIGRGYIRTQNAGWIWLGASVLWSKLVTFIAHTWLRKIPAGTSLTFTNAVGLLQEVIGMTFFLLAIMYLSRGRRPHDATAI